jgi:hypothetical protein
LNNIKIGSLTSLEGDNKLTRIKTALEIALEKANEINILNPEEKEKIKAEEKIKSLLAKYFKGSLSSIDLWQKLKGNNLFILREAQLILINSLNFKNSKLEYKIRKDAILAIETLKERKNTSTIESILNEIILLNNDYLKKKEEIENILKKEIKKNPQARLKTVKQGNKLIITQLSVEEALQENVQWKNFIIQHEEKYTQEFKEVIERLKKEI